MEAAGLVCSRCFKRLEFGSKNTGFKYVFFFLDLVDDIFGGGKRMKDPARTLSLA